MYFDFTLSESLGWHFAYIFKCSQTLSKDFTCFTFSCVSFVPASIETKILTAPFFIPFIIDLLFLIAFV